MKKPVVVIMAAGLGSRYGGFKQIAPVDREGHTLTDYSLFDACRAGFERAVFVIAPGMEKDFRESIGGRVEKRMDVAYAEQRLDDLPKGFSIPEGRSRPWGTGHAVLAARKHVDSNFAAVNADDFYGASAFKSLYEFLRDSAGEDKHAMVGYKIGNTLSENGSVSRGVCRCGNGSLLEVTERTQIEPRPGGAAYSEDGGKSFTFVPHDTIVSLNLWGFGLSVMSELEKGFAGFLTGGLAKNPLKCEYYLPSAANALLKGAAKIRVLPTDEKWFGVTYAADMTAVRAAVDALREKGAYPRYLWDT